MILDILSWLNVTCRLTDSPTKTGCRRRAIHGPGLTWVCPKFRGQTAWFHTGSIGYLRVTYTAIRRRQQLMDYDKINEFSFLDFRVMHECFLLLAGFPGQYLISRYVLHCRRRENSVFLRCIKLKETNPQNLVFVFLWR